MKCHVNNVCTKANKTFDFLRRNLSISSTSVKDQAYKHLTRSPLEYACSAWDPCNKGEIGQFEMVQRSVDRFVTRQWNTSSVGDMLQAYEIANENVAITKKNDRLIQPLRQSLYINSSSFIILRCKTQQRQEYTRLWNEIKIKLDF